MTDTLDRIWQLRQERERFKALLDAYNTVREHIAPKLEPDSIVVVMLDEQRYEIDCAMEKVATKMASIRAACLHAWERIGEAKPPFEQCVRCALTRPPTGGE